MKKVNFVQPYIGTDTEFFISKKGSVIGAEKVLNKNDKEKGIIVDGVQGEINPAPTYCRAIMRDTIKNMIDQLSNIAKREGGQIDFVSNCTLSKEEYDSLSDQSKEFGCMPSYDIYKKGAESTFSVKGNETMQRTAGGHIHLGCKSVKVKIESKQIDPVCLKCPEICKETLKIDEKDISNIMPDYGLSVHKLQKDFKDMNLNKEDLEKFKKTTGIKFFEDTKIEFKFGSIEEALRRPDLIIPTLDLIVGIPSVLLDRDENAKTRRILYGKAGNYRLPVHGIEYRTLSNFWMISYPIMSFIFGMARHAHLLVALDLDNEGTILKELFKGLKKKDIENTINQNDFKSARDIFIHIEQHIIDSAATENNFPIYNRTSSNAFKTFIVNGGIFNYFDRNIFNNWKKINRGGNNNNDGWENWSRNNIIIDPDIETKFSNFVAD